MFLQGIKPRIPGRPTCNLFNMSMELFRI